ncbi:hypothetical protein SODALDRAFT_356691 [Sodiomyces alkalinus F11]|uniref:Uncharacterized protein n=1 Tax=Sodiomyces alkalinus (strain CBS 110278 / VKM F-3762 / F11) TaxID=1314773 RepID=A0A3N2Q1R7_SODAK|nr:hypothetical protein SODALDRAFT_356691 [Sodiomyces alkalinus F11]ROT40682.1 hypothetical protein SODALDRAFT_356691 [Sodiomyces alkalinus F11]
MEDWRYTRIWRNPCLLVGFPSTNLIPAFLDSGHFWKCPDAPKSPSPPFQYRRFIRHLLVVQSNPTKVFMEPAQRGRLPIANAHFPWFPTVDAQAATGPRKMEKDPAVNANAVRDNSKSPWNMDLFFPCEPNTKQPLGIRNLKRPGRHPEQRGGGGSLETFGMRQSILSHLSVVTHVGSLPESGLPRNPQPRKEFLEAAKRR